MDHHGDLGSACERTSDYIHYDHRDCRRRIYIHNASHILHFFRLGTVFRNLDFIQLDADVRILHLNQLGTDFRIHNTTHILRSYQLSAKHIINIQHSIQRTSRPIMPSRHNLQHHLRHATGREHLGRRLLARTRPMEYNQSLKTQRNLKHTTAHNLERHDQTPRRRDRELQICQTPEGWLADVGS
jgi:hypothetical protein